MAIYALENAIQKYDWGDPDILPVFLAKDNPHRDPWAELWIGTHPKAMSLAITPGGARLPLDRVLDGGLTDGRPALPFMLKLLAVASPLSMQVHPSARKAVEGYQREQLAAIPLEAAERNYVDRNAKSEFVVALERFEGMCGFRPVDDILATLRLVAGPHLKEYVGRFAADPCRRELAVLFYTFISMSESRKTDILSKIRPRIDQLLQTERPGSPVARVLGWIPRLMDAFPGDMGALGPMLLNTFELEPGQGLAVPPGEPHAYFRGFALEAMASSDNEVRGGLTRKRVDMPEFIAALNFDTPPLQIQEPSRRKSGFRPYDAKSDDFTLAVMDLDGRYARAQRRPGPELLLCVSGGLRLEGSGGDAVDLARGQAAFVSSDETGYSMTGAGTVFRALGGSRIRGVLTA